MKKAKRILFKSLLVLSLVCNLFLSYFLYENIRPDASVMHFGFENHNIDVYCERRDDETVMHAILEEGIFKLGKAEIHNKDELYFISPKGKYNLSQMGGDAFIVNSDGELLYQMVKSENTEAENEESEKVFVAPSGEKYHSDIYCAGKRSFETDLKTAELFGRKPCSICF